jgi:hypothetical protein
VSDDDELRDVPAEVRAALLPVRAAALEDAARWIATGVPRAQLVPTAIELCRVLGASNVIASEYVDAVAEFVERLAARAEG